MKQTRMALWVVVGVWLVAVSPAWAQTAAQTKQARAAYAQGHSEFREGNYEAAMAAFQRAYDTVPNPVVLISIAETQQRLGLWADAEKTLTRYLEERPDAPDRPQVEQQLASIRARPGTLRVESTPAGAVIVVDGADTGAITPADLSLEPGPHQITLHGVTGVEKQGAVEIEYGGQHVLQVDLSLPPEEVPAAAEQAEAVEEGVDEADGLQRVRTAAWTSLGIGLAGAVTGGVLGGFALKKQNAFNADPTAASADKGERFAIFADVGFGIAVAGVVTSIVLFTAGRAEKRSEQAARGSRRRASVTPLLGRRGAGLATQVRF